MEIRSLKIEDTRKLKSFYQELGKSSKWVLFEDNENAYEGIRNYIEKIINNPKSICIVSLVDEQIVGHITGEVSTYKKKDHIMILSTGMVGKHTYIWTKMYDTFLIKAKEIGIHKIECSVAETNYRIIQICLAKGFLFEGHKADSINMNDRFIGEYIFGKVL